MKLNWNFLGGGGAKQKPSLGGVWIFSGTAQLLIPIMNLRVTYRMSNICNKHNNVGNF